VLLISWKAKIECRPICVKHDIFILFRMLKINFFILKVIDTIYDNKKAQINKHDLQKSAKILLHKNTKNWFLDYLNIITHPRSYKL